MSMLAILAIGECVALVAMAGYGIYAFVRRRYGHGCAVVLLLALYFWSFFAVSTVTIGVTQLDRYDTRTFHPRGLQYVYMPMHYYDSYFPEPGGVILWR